MSAISSIKTIRLKDHVKLQNGHPFNSSSFEKNPNVGQRVIRIRDLSSDNDPIYSQEPCPDDAIIKNKDIIIGMDGDFNISYWSKGSAALNQRLCKISQISNQLNQKYLYYALPKELKQINHLTHATTVKHLSSNQILNIKIPLPPLETQRQIAAYLDRKTEAIDALISKKQRLIELLEEKRTALINHVVTKGLDPSVPMKDSGVPWIGQIPEGWKIRKLKHITNSIQTGKTPSTQIPEYYENETVPWFGPSDIIPGKKISNSNKKINIKAINEGAAPIYQENTILIVCIGATTGKVSLTTIKSSSNQQITALTLDKNQNPTYQLHTLNSFKKALIGRALYTTMPIINNYELGNHLTISPPTKQQIEIGNHIDKLNIYYDISQVKLQTQIEKLQEYRQALITAAVTGQLDLDNDRISDDPEEMNNEQTSLF